MLTLASLIWALYMYSASELHMMKHPPPMPVVIEVGGDFKYSPIDSAIYTPYPYRDTCYTQEQLAFQMLNHFNNFRNGKNKVSPEVIDIMARHWVCVTDDKN